MNRDNTPASSDADVEVNDKRDRERGGDCDINGVEGDNESCSHGGCDCGLTSIDDGNQDGNEAGDKGGDNNSGEGGGVCDVDDDESDRDGGGESVGYDDVEGSNEGCDYRVGDGGWGEAHPIGDADGEADDEGVGGCAVDGVGEDRSHGGLKGGDDYDDDDFDDGGEDEAYDVSKGTSKSYGYCGSDDRFAINDDGEEAGDEGGGEIGGICDVDGEVGGCDGVKGGNELWGVGDSCYDDGLAGGSIGSEAMDEAGDEGDGEFDGEDEDNGVDDCGDSDRVDEVHSDNTSSQFAICDEPHFCYNWWHYVYGRIGLWSDIKIAFTVHTLLPRPTDCVDFTSSCREDPKLCRFTLYRYYCCSSCRKYLRKFRLSEPATSLTQGLDPQGAPAA
ncbi:unnamed protein product [Protopolystoma xenopodis]|uniref:Uncharacterized protein n=1 Tax=Protopolystoma xenopodis TaxID=117903 RepID=A0A3S5BL56_9PLAT|nr:unnamed protein product [Protopolystoma xenopodis]